MLIFLLKRILELRGKSKDLNIMNTHCYSFVLRIYCRSHVPVFAWACSASRVSFSSSCLVLFLNHSAGLFEIYYVAYSTNTLLVEVPLYFLCPLQASWLNLSPTNQRHPNLPDWVSAFLPNFSSTFLPAYCQSLFDSSWNISYSVSPKSNWLSFIFKSDLLH